MAEVERDEQHKVSYRLRMDEADIRRVLAKHLADRVGVTLGRPGVTSEVMVRESGAQGVTVVEVVADVLITIDELELAHPVCEVAHG